MSKIILLVEDNPSDEKLTVRALKNCGVANEVHVERDGAAALEYLATHELPAIVLLDLKLPKLDGLDVIGRIRSDPRTRLVPVIVLTSSKEDEDIVASFSRGANAYVRKPVDFTEFAEAARALGLFWLLHNEPVPRS
jgi:two-component system, response regulator